MSYEIKKFNKKLKVILITFFYTKKKNKLS
jgi:hypothetical protein